MRTERGRLINELLQPLEIKGLREFLSEGASQSVELLPEVGEVSQFLDGGLSLFDSLFPIQGL